MRQRHHSFSMFKGKIYFCPLTMTGIKLCLVKIKQIHLLQYFSAVVIKKITKSL